MTSINGLDSALSGLSAAQQQLSVIADNVSNASTAGYTRKILPQEQQVVDGVTIGVSTDAITRNVDLDLEKEFWTQQSSVSYLNTQASYLNQIQQFNGPPDSDSSIAAQVSALQNSFASLSDDPSNSGLQGAAVSAAQNVADKLNDFGDLMTQMRNTTQTDMQTTVADVNSKLQQIAAANSQIKFNLAAGKSVAALDDTRDNLVNSLSQDMNLSFFTRSDGVLVVQTAQGVQLADETAQTVTFNPAQITATSSYPASAAGIFVGDPAKERTAIDITSSGTGGKLGALINLRDTTLPQQQASLDEMAEQLAQRFNQQGLKLFTNSTGNIPANTAPNTSTNPPTAVPYVGFASTIQVNSAVLQDNSLVQKGTAATDDPVQSGSNEVIRRITDFTFGATNYQQAVGTVSLTGGPDLQTSLGLFSSNQITGASALSNSASLTSLMAGAPSVFNPATPGTSDTFNLNFSELRGALPSGTMTINVSLSQAQADFPGASNAAQQVASEINKQIATAVAGTPAFSGLTAAASVNAYGQLVLNSRGDISVDTPPAATGDMQQAGLTYLGLTAGTQKTTDPYLTVQVGADPPVNISIKPGDTAADLVTKLQGTSAGGVAGLSASLSPGGQLTLRPGDSATSPTFGGDLTITGGPFTTTGGASVVAALFGSGAPVVNVGYTQPNASGPATPFRTNNLGPGANISTGIASDGSLIDYSQQVINTQAQLANNVATQQTDETSYANTLQKSLQDNSGVNVDQELSNMIVAQTAYSAAARVVSAIQAEFQALLQAF